MTRLGILFVLLAACGGDDSSAKKDSGVTQHDAPKMDAPIDTGKVFMDAPAGTRPLILKNVLSWCTVSVDGGTASAAAMQQVNVMPGVINLVATANTGFILDA